MFVDEEISGLNAPDIESLYTGTMAQQEVAKTIPDPPIPERS